MTGAVNRVEQVVSRLNERIDRLLEMHAAPPRGGAITAPLFISVPPITFP